MFQKPICSLFLSIVLNSRRSSLLPWAYESTRVRKFLLYIREKFDVRQNIRKAVVSGHFTPFVFRVFATLWPKLKRILRSLISPARRHSPKPEISDTSFLKNRLWDPDGSQGFRKNRVPPLIEVERGCLSYIYFQRHLHLFSVTGGAFYL